MTEPRQYWFSQEMRGGFAGDPARRALPLLGPFGEGLGHFKEINPYLDNPLRLRIGGTLCRAKHADRPRRDGTDHPGFLNASLAAVSAKLRCADTLPFGIPQFFVRFRWSVGRAWHRELRGETRGPRTQGCRTDLVTAAVFPASA